MPYAKDTTKGKQNIPAAPEASNDPYATGNAVAEAPAVTYVAPPPAPTSPTAAQRAQAAASEAAARNGTPAVAAPTPVSAPPTQINPQTGFVMGSPEDQAAINAPATNAGAFGGAPPVQDANYYDTANAAVDKVNYYAEQVKAQQEQAKLKLAQDQAQQDRLNGGSAGGGNNVNTYGGVGTGSTTTTTGNVGGGTTSSGSGGTSGQPAIGSGDAYIEQALNTQFTWDATTDPDYKIAATNAENEVAQMMVGRGGLWSSVTQNALTNKLFVLQADYRKQAYSNYVDNRNFLMQVAQIRYGREDAAWDKNMKIMQYNADREDAAFSKSMQQQNLALSQSNAAFNQKMQEAQQKQANIAPKLNMAIGNYTVASNNFASLKSAWEKSGSASQEVANYFGVIPGTPIASTSGANAVSRKSTGLSNTYDTLMSTAYNYDQDAAYLAGLNNFASADTGTTNWKDMGSTSQAANYSSALATGQSMDTAGEVSTYISSILQNYQSTVDAMGAGYAAQLLDDLRAEASKKPR